MRKVIISDIARHRIDDLENHLLYELMLSKEACIAYIDHMEQFIASLRANVDYQKCRFKQWRALGWRCAVFEHSWIIAYEVYVEGVVIREIRHTKLLAN